MIKPVPYAAKMLFTKAPASWISRFIRWGAGGDEVTHVGLQVGPDEVISAEWPKVISHTIAHFMEGRILHARFEETLSGTKARNTDGLRSRVGTDYDLFGLPGAAMSRFAWLWFGKKVNNPTDSEKRAWCSELMRVAYPSLPEFAGLRADAVSPGDLLRRLEAGGPSFRRIAA